MEAVSTTFIRANKIYHTSVVGQIYEKTGNTSCLEPIECGHGVSLELHEVPFEGANKHLSK